MSEPLAEKKLKSKKVDKPKYLIAWPKDYWPCIFDLSIITIIETFEDGWLCQSGERLKFFTPIFITTTTFDEAHQIWIKTIDDAGDSLVVDPRKL